EVFCALRRRHHGAVAIGRQRDLELCVTTFRAIIPTPEDDGGACRGIHATDCVHIVGPGVICGRQQRHCLSCCAAGQRRRQRRQARGLRRPSMARVSAPWIRRMTVWPATEHPLGRILSTSGKRSWSTDLRRRETWPRNEVLVGNS